MEIHGFQKMTLLDYPGKVACTVFTGGCNMRCPFCHNAFLVTELSRSEHFSQQEILELIASRKKLLDGVAVTGGEPLLTEDTLDFLARLKDLGLAVKLDTNGSFPDRLQRAVREGLVDYVAMVSKTRRRRMPPPPAYRGWRWNRSGRACAFCSAAPWTTNSAQPSWPNTTRWRIWRRSAAGSRARAATICKAS